MPPAQNRLRVLIVEDEADYREELIYLLCSAGIEARGVSDARALYHRLEQWSPHVVILDVGLPGEDGFSVLKQLRHHDNLGVIMLTARGAQRDKVQGLLSGADAYLVKPVPLPELTATLWAVVRRIGTTPTPPPARHWQLSRDGWTLFKPDGDTVALTTSERLFVDAMARSGTAGQAVPRETLVLAMGGNPDIYDPHRLETLVSRLRAKAGPAFPLKTVRGVGYCLTRPIELPPSS